MDQVSCGTLSKVKLTQALRRAWHIGKATRDSLAIMARRLYISPSNFCSHLLCPKNMPMIAINPSVCPQEVVGSLDVRTLKPQSLEKEDAFVDFAKLVALLALRGFLCGAALSKTDSHRPCSAFHLPTSSFPPPNPQSSPHNPAPTSSIPSCSRKHRRTMVGLWVVGGALL